MPWASSSSSVGSIWPSISANGRYVAFISGADNLVENDTNKVTDAFVHDRKTGRRLGHRSTQTDIKQLITAEMARESKVYLSAGTAASSRSRAPSLQSCVRRYQPHK